MRTPTLAGIRLVTLACNVPGPVAVARLHSLGASVVKIEPPAGDHLERAAPRWYAALCDGCAVQRLNLKEEADRSKLDAYLQDAHLFVTSSRPSALARLGLAWDDVHRRHPRLSQIAIVGETAPHVERSGHDLTYLAKAGLLDPPSMPKTLLADLAGAERTVSAALEALYRVKLGLEPECTYVGLFDVLETFAMPFEHRLTAPGGSLAGGFAGYGIYRTRDGWIAVAALEPRFIARLQKELGEKSFDRAAFQAKFLEKDACEWEAWGAARDLPIVALKNQDPQTAAPRTA